MPANTITLTYWTDLAEGAAPVADRLDKQAGILRNVLVCGLTSPNCPHVPGSKAQPSRGTKYTPEALKNAAPLYEGIKVRKRLKEHKPSSEENEIIGVLRDVRISESGLRADLHFALTHKFAPELIEDVERKLGRWGLSHVAQGGGPVEDGWLIVKHIPKVRGVDLVDDPATTVSLLESTTVAKIRFVDLLEWVAASPKLKPAKGKRSRILELAESDLMTGKLKEDEMPMGDMPVDAPPEAPAADSDPDAALMAAFEQACAPLVSAALGGDEDALKKLNEWIKAHIKLASGGEKKEAPKEGGEKKEGDGEKKEPPAESKESVQVAELTRKLARYENRGKVVTLAESLGCKEKTALPESLIETLVEVSETRWKPTITDYIARSRGPKSSGPATLPFDAPKPTETKPDLDAKIKAIAK